MGDVPLLCALKVWTLAEKWSGKRNVLEDPENMEMMN